MDIKQSKVNKKFIEIALLRFRTASAVHLQNIDFPRSGTSNGGLADCEIPRGCARPAGGALLAAAIGWGLGISELSGRPVGAGAAWICLALREK